MRVDEGLTLIELAVVMAIIGSLTLIALPRLVAFGQETRFRADVRRVIGASALARSESVTRGRPIELSVDGVSSVLSIMIDKEVVWTRSLSVKGAVAGLRVRGGKPERQAVITYKPDGRVTETAIYMAEGDLELTLYIEPLTGQARTLEGRVEYDWEG